MQISSCSLEAGSDGPFAALEAGTEEGRLALGATTEPHKVGRCGRHVKRGTPADRDLVLQPHACSSKSDIHRTGTVWRRSWRHASWLARMAATA